MIVCAHSKLVTYTHRITRIRTHMQVFVNPPPPVIFFANCAIAVNVIMHYLCIAMQQTVWLSFQNVIKRKMESFKIISNQTSDVSLK